jgi:putative ABC transport system permease protein
VIGLLGSVLGLVAGLGIAKGMVALFSALGVDLPEASTVVNARTVIVSILLGTGITLLASILPARRATRVPPIAAVREGAELPVKRIGASWFVKPLVRLVGLPARRAGGVAGELAGANAVRNPGRTASTAAALMIGLTLVTVVAVLGAGINNATKSAVTKQLDADYVVDGKQGLPFSAAEGDKLAATPGVTSASHVRSDTAIVQGEQLPISGIDPATIADFYKFEWSGGSEEALGTLGTDGAVVTKDYAEAEKLELGGQVSLMTPSGEERTLVVRGIYDPPQAKQLLGPISMTQQGFDEAFTQPKNSHTFIDADASAAAPLKAATKGLGDATYHVGAEFPKDATKEMATMLALLYVLLGFSVIVSLFGMVNTMVLSVFERTREIGMLRTIGMTRRQARRMIRHESVITALIGTALGLGLGLFLAGLVTKAVAMDDLGLTIPLVPLAAFTLVAVVAGIGAAILPARRASRLNVLDALHYE